ncbi:MAG: autotransporter-associated beta strand repeat-containing protein [Kiritimatiellae bacterium]|nr:autotransporter-associated beta strand repeat-containing protein [Kiritimatiellia bacterium]
MKLRKSVLRMGRGELGILMGMALSILSASADLCQWKANPADGVFANSANWEDGAVPGANDTADFSAATGDTTITLAAAATVARIVYEPAVSGNTTNKLTLAGQTLTFKPSGITVGEQAILETACDVLTTDSFVRDGAGEWRISALLGSTSDGNRYLNQYAGRITLASGGKFDRIRYNPGQAVESPAPTEFVMEEGSIVDPIKCGDWQPPQTAGSRSRIDIKGGTFLVNNFKNGGCFLNGFQAYSYGEMNISGGVMEGDLKTLHAAFNGTGVVNQTGGVMRWKNIYVSSNKTDDYGAYNLLGGELWLGGSLGGIIYMYAASEFRAAGDAKMVVTADLTIQTAGKFHVDGRLEMDVTNSASTCQFQHPFDGSGEIVKTGPGTLSLNGNAKRAYTGPITVSNGTVTVNVAALSGTNDITVAGGSFAALTPVAIKSLTVCGTGVLTSSSSAMLTLPADARIVHARDNGVLDFTGGKCFAEDVAFALEDNASIRIAAGSVMAIKSLTTNGVQVADGLYPASEYGFVQGGTLLVGGKCIWTGGAANGLWSDAGNWAGGIRPSDVTAGGADFSATSGVLTQDVSPTVGDILYAPGTGAVLSNRSSSVLAFSEDAVITVGEGDTFVLDGPVRIDSTFLVKRGKGDLVISGDLYAKEVSTIPMAYLYVQEGRCFIEGAVTNVAIASAQMEEKRDEGTPEVVFRNGSSFGGSCYICTTYNNHAKFDNMGNGLFTQLGGTVRPGCKGWGTAVELGASPSSHLAATGTYHLVDGTFEIAAGNILRFGPSYGIFGVFIQSGGTSYIGGYNSSYGRIELHGGTMCTRGRGDAVPVTLDLYGGTFSTYDDDASVGGAWTLHGETTFDIPQDRAMSFVRPALGTGTVVKTGLGTFTATFIQTNDMVVSAGTMVLNGSVLGSLALAEGATLDLPGTISVRQFSYGGTSYPDGMTVTKDECAGIKGAGAVVIGDVTIGQWTGNASDGSWNSPANWSGGMRPSGASVSVDLSAATGTLAYDYGSITLGGITYAPLASGQTLTNSSEVNSLTLAADGVITVGEGQTLVIDHALLMGGQYAYKRGKGTLILRRGMAATSARAGSDNYFSIEAGRVITEGCVTNIIPETGARDRSDPDNVPEFVVKGDNASLLGRTFLTAMNNVAPSPTDPGSGLFTQDGGLVSPNHTWGNQANIGWGDSNATLGGTGTYHLVSGTLRFPANKQFVLTSGRAYGLFIQDGGLFENNGSFHVQNGSVYLNGGEMRLNAMAGNQNILMYFKGGTFHPLAQDFTSAVWIELDSNGVFQVDKDCTLTLTRNNVFSGRGELNKEGEGTMVVQTVSQYYYGPVNVREGTLDFAGSIRDGDMTVSPGATLRLACGETSQFNPACSIKVERNGRLVLNGTGSISVDSLMLGDFPQRGHGRRYGSSDHVGEVDVVNDVYFSGPGVLVVTGRTRSGTLIKLR